MPENVLVIEKQFDAARQIAKALEAEGFFVFTASSAEAGLVMARRVRPSLILLDLPVGDAVGMEFMGRLRAMEHLRAVPVLVLAAGDEQYEPRLRDLYGIAGFIQTPLDDNEITAKSRAALEEAFPSDGAPPFLHQADDADATIKKEKTKTPDEADEDEFIRLTAEGEDLYAGENGVSFSYPNEERPGAGEDSPERKEKDPALTGWVSNSATGGEPPAAYDGTGQDSPEQYFSLGDGPGEKGRPENENEFGDENKDKKGFESRLERAMGGGKDGFLFGGEDLPGRAEKKKTEDDTFKEGAGLDMGKEEEREEDQGEDELSSFGGRTKAKEAKNWKKNLVLVLFVVLLGAAASFIFLMRFGKKGPFSIFRAAKIQPPAMEKNAPAFVTAPAVPVNAVAANSSSAQPAAANPPATAVNPSAQPAKAGKAKTKNKIKIKKIKNAAPHVARRRVAVYRARLRPRVQSRPRLTRHQARGLRPLQVGAFSIRANASRYEEKLKAEGFHAYVVRVSSFYKVLVDKFKSAGDERAAFEKLKKGGFNPFRYSGR